MQQRVIAAGLFIALAFAILLIRYLPPRVALHELGDPLDHVVLSGFYQAEAIDNVLGRRAGEQARIRVPLADGRGVARIAVQLRAADRPAVPFRLSVGASTLVLQAPTALRTLHLITPPQPARNIDLRFAAIPDQSEPNVIVDRVVAWGRSGAPTSPDLLAMLALALLPGLLVALTARLPLDWALLPGMVALGLLALLPAGDRAMMLRVGPLVSVIVAAVAALPTARTYPAIAVVALGGALLRVYAVGWGGGYVFQADELNFVQAQGGIVGVIAGGVAWIAARFSGEAAWRDAWTVLLIGRVVSGVFGTALVVAVYSLGRILLRPRWALMAACFVAVAPLAVQQSHYATSTQLEALLVVLLLLFSTSLAIHGSAVALVGSGGLAVLVSLVAAQPLPLLAAPMVALLNLRHMRRLALLGAGVAIVIFGLAVGRYAASAALLPPATTVLASGAAPDVLVWQRGTLPPYLYALFNILAWGLGPLLMQLGLVGWGVGVIQSARPMRLKITAVSRAAPTSDRAWLPLLITIAAYFLVVARSPVFDLQSLVILVPVLCLLAALLLQTFGQRLTYEFGRRVVRLLATLSLLLALVVSVGLVNVYREPDTRVAASRWLIARAAPSQAMLHDRSLVDRLPLGVTHAYTRLTLPPASSTPTDTQRAQFAAILQRAQFVVIGVERSDVDLKRLAAHDPLTACYYGALFDGRLGFAPRARFVAEPHIGTWTFDDRNTDAMLRVNERPRVYIWERFASPTPQALNLMLNCATGQP